MSDFTDRTIEEEIWDVRKAPPHAVLLGAAAESVTIPAASAAMPLLRLSSCSL